MSINREVGRLQPNVGFDPTEERIADATLKWAFADIA
jgi:hypothetical protein